MRLTNEVKYIKHCIELSRKSVNKNGKPFGALIVRNGKIIAESINGAKKDITYHAEILVMRKAMNLLNTKDLSSCTLYSNCEPCPMCAFMIREYKVGRVVFALRSPYMGGYTKWDILQDPEINEFDPSIFGKVPEILFGICKEEAAEVFDSINWKMYEKRTALKNSI